MRTLTLTDGTSPPRDIPYKELAAMERVLSNGTWSTNNVLIIWKPEWCWDVRLYWTESTWEFRGWYVNIQDPVRRDSSGFTTTDHFLDLLVAPDRTIIRKDSDELRDAVELGMYSASKEELIRRSADQVSELVESHAWPFDGDLRSFRPPSSWPVPPLPRLP